MKQMTLILAMALVSGQATALEFMKCNSHDGKTLWASFGKRVNSTEVKYFATELTLFRSDRELQQRILFRNSKEALAASPIDYSPGEISFTISSVGRDGAPSSETLYLRIFSHKSKTAYSGIWTTEDSTGLRQVPLACSVY